MALGVPTVKATPEPAVLDKKASVSPHISCEPGDFGETVLMPGDPLRAKLIAETYLEKAVLVNNVRGVQGYTGYYKGKRISVMASGMGMPSIGIYSYELFTMFGVKQIIRVGSAGSISDDMKLYDIVIGQATCTDSGYVEQYKLPGRFCPIGDFGLIQEAVKVCENSQVRYKVGNLFSSDRFYDDSQSTLEWEKMGVLAVEMEAAALYCNAARTGRKALCICTISDEIKTGAKTTSDERQNAFHAMMQIALDIAANTTA
ncbi:purine nucleoside phosphorylase deoD-type [Gregarina niphandrodes]|uniref:Purine nucleoside phosphorylase deoD-type n=1 Tax=Gregarina niphandrodes TaxID=110365 RepID=A0A023B0K8_GRENI|nr:purine nucleoside phosphorylase deoD-type [Gregarina niphandrodes]EZG45401.1 purine nucleoside phosphorylase deoD-type [Gregarina niphandrodes]|eukprot:XP_011132507.1 purine nucleoside phosphorylase deoD-type [Gregarina niphandrodes]